MRTEIFFKDIRRSDYAENFINDKVESLLNKLTPWDNDAHVVVRIEQDRQRTDLRHGIYQCEVTLKSGMKSKTYKASRQDRNLFRALVACFDTLKVILAKNHDRRNRDRSRRQKLDHRRFSLPPMTTLETET